MANKTLFAVIACLCLGGLASAQSQGITEVRIAIISPGGGAAMFRPAATAAIPVTIFSSNTFDATQVEGATLTLVAPRVKLFARAKSCQPREMNANGRLDLSCRFQADPSVVQPGISPVVLEGRTGSGLRFRGSATVQIVSDEVMP